MAAIASELLPELNNWFYSNPVPNKKKNSYTVYVNPDSKSKGKRIRFQATHTLGGEEELCTCPFGLSEPFDEKSDPTRRNLELSINSPQLLQFLEGVDAANLRAARDHLVEDKDRRVRTWFPKKKAVTEAKLVDRYNRVVKYSSDESQDYPPRFRVKISMPNPEMPNRPVTKIYLQRGEGQPLEPGTYDDIVRNVRVVPVVSIGGIWFTNTEFGMTLNCEQLLVYPDEDQGVGFTFADGMEPPAPEPVDPEPSGRFVPSAPGGPVEEDPPEPVEDDDVPPPTE